MIKVAGSAWVKIDDTHILFQPLFPQRLAPHVYLHVLRPISFTSSTLPKLKQIHYATAALWLGVHLHTCALHVFVILTHIRIFLKHKKQSQNGIAPKVGLWSKGPAVHGLRLMIRISCFNLPSPSDWHRTCTCTSSARFVYFLYTTKLSYSRFITRRWLSG